MDVPQNLPAPKKPATTSNPPASPTVAATNHPGQPAPVVVPVRAADSVPLFGGLRGGRARKDGLKPGSPEALEADRKKDALRKQVQRERIAALKESEPIPPATVVASGQDAAGAMVPGVAGVPVVETGPVGLVVPWTARLLQKPARLLTRILDRMRKWDLFRRLDKSKLPESFKAEIKSDCEWKDAAKEDFADALAECAAIELNKHQVSSQNSHWVNLALSAGELAMAHIAVCERIDKAILALAANPLSNPQPEKKVSA